MSVNLTRNLTVQPLKEWSVRNAGRLSPKIANFLNHPAGPFTIHFWAPTWKWGLVIAGLADMKRSPANLSVAQNCALAATGFIWSRYSTVITPVNYNLLSVNFFVGVTGSTQLYRIYKFRQEEKKKLAKK